MATGESGVRGTHVVRLVKKANNHELVNATHRLLSMAGNRAKGNQVNVNFATRTFIAQVTFVCLSLLGDKS